MSILSGGTNRNESESGEAVLFGLHSYTSLALADGAVTARTGADGIKPAPAELLASKNVILLAYDPRSTSADVLDRYRAWLATRFQSCLRLSDSAAVVEYFLDAAFSCELAVAARPRTVDYANGIQLGNLLVDFKAGYLDLQLLWTRLPADAHAIAIQFIDAEGARVDGADFVIGLQPLARQRIDTSTLPAGDYQVKLILYAYASGASVPGTLVASGSNFDRALEIDRLSISQTDRTGNE